MKPKLLVAMTNERYGKFMDDDFDDIDEFELLDIDEEEEPVPTSGISPWSFAWILADGASTILRAFDHVLYNIKIDLTYRHNRAVDSDDFIGSVRAGLEKL